jgi:hypothetical protein
MSFEMHDFVTSKEIRALLRISSPSTLLKIRNQPGQWGWIEGIDWYAVSGSHPRYNRRTIAEWQQARAAGDIALRRASLATYQAELAKIKK